MQGQVHVAARCRRTSSSSAARTRSRAQKLASLELARVVKATSMSQPSHTGLLETLLSGVVQSEE